MRRSYEVVIVGAGIVGLSIAYNLVKRGCGRVLILEKEDSWIGGSTARANGGFRQQFSTAANIRLSQLSLPVFERFKEEFGTDISLQQNGYLFVTASEKVELDLKRNQVFQNEQGVEVEWLSPSEVKETAPFLETSDLRGAAFCRRDGQADAYSIASGFGTVALRLGAELELDTEALGIQTRRGQVRGVETSRGSVPTGVVVNATGPYAGVFGKRCGVKIPVDPVRRMLVMTEDFPAIAKRIPMTIDADTGFLMRKESDRVLMGWSDPAEPPGFNLRFDPSFIDVVAEKAVRRVPILAQAQINPRRSWAGLYEVTPDHHCILGEAPEIAGYFLANGFSGHGMMHSPAVGMLLADLILDGHTGHLDLDPLRLSRFEEGDLIQETVVL